MAFTILDFWTYLAEVSDDIGIHKAIRYQFHILYYWGYGTSVEHCVALVKNYPWHYTFWAPQHIKEMIHRLGDY